MKTSTRISALALTTAMLALAACRVPTPVAAPAAQQAPAAQPAAPAAEIKKWCSDMHIVFFPGGPAGGVFANNVYNGAKAAEADLGPRVDYVFSDWDPQKMIAQFKEATATKPDGIAIMGHPGDEAFDPVIDDARSKGILVTSQNTSLPKAMAKYQGGGFGYVGQDLYGSGKALAEEAVKRYNLQKGDRAMVWGLLSQPTRGLRTQGVIDALKNAGLEVDYIEIDAATNKDPASGVPTFTGYASSHPDLKLVVTDHGGLTATLETYLKSANLDKDKVYGIGFDLSPATLTGIRNGAVDLVIDQQPFLQGYLPIVQLCLTKVYGFSGLSIDTGGGFADKDNVEFLAPLVEKEIR